MMNLRRKTQFKDIIKPDIMQLTKLPTHLDILRHYVYINNISTDINKIKIDILDRLKIIWNSASLPIMSDNSIITKINIYIQKAIKLKKTQNSKYFNVVMKKHMDKFNFLFDICACKCANKCDCRRENKVPPSEKSFLNDQRTQRLMFIQTSSTTATTKQSRTHEPVYSIPGPSSMDIDPRYIIKILFS